MTEIIDNLPPQWAAAFVRDLGTIRLGRHRSPDKLSGQFPVKYLRAANVTATGLDLADIQEMDFTSDEQEVYELRSGDILLAEASGSPTHVGRAAIWRDEIPGCCFQNTLIRFRPYAIRPEYALIVFRHYLLSGEFARIAKGVGIQHLGASRFAKMPVALPPMAEQERIVRKVEERTTELQKAEGALNSAITHIKEQVREVLAAAATGTLIPKSTPAGLPKKEIITRTAHSDSGQNTIPSPDADRLGMAPEREMTGAAEEGLFPLPPDWKWVNVAEAGEVTIGRKREPKYHDGPNMRPYLRVANVLEDRIDTTDLLRMNFSPEEYETYSLRNGDILLNEGQSPELVGRPAMYRGEVAGACFQMTLLRFRASPAVDPQFALLVFRHYLHSGEFRKIARWTTNIAHLTLKRFSAMPFPLPPKSTQLDIAREAQRRLDETSMQLSAATASLERLPGIEAQLYAAAANGQILPQDDRDEPASELLSRLGPPYPEPTRNRRHIRSSRPKAPDRTTPVQEAATGPYTDTLSSVLSVAGVSMPLPELFRRARYDRDSTQDIEEFYLILREELGSTVRISGDAGENASVEAVPDENR